MSINLQLFVHTVEEYKKFSSILIVSPIESMVDDYNEADYVGIHTRTMLLRKYYSNTSNVYIESILNKAKSLFPMQAAELQKLQQRFTDIIKSQLQHILSDGTKQNLYETIEDTVYGLLLHADKNRVVRLIQTSEAIRYTCIRKFTLEMEELVFELFEMLKKCGINSINSSSELHAPIVYLGNPAENTQSIKSSKYWSNLYGHDASDKDLTSIFSNMTNEELSILYVGTQFLSLLNQDTLPVRQLKKLVHPMTRGSWGNFSEAQLYFRSISNPGIDNRITYNPNKTIAYVRILKNVDAAFCINSPHIINDINEISLVKRFGHWKVYSLGAHLDSIYK